MSWLCLCALISQVKITGHFSKKMQRVSFATHYDVVSATMHKKIAEKIKGYKLSN